MPVRDRFQECEAFVDLLAGEGLETAGGKGLAGEGGDDRSLDDGLTDVLEFVGLTSCGGQIARESPQEGVPCPGRVGDFGEREGGAAEETWVFRRHGGIGGEQECSELTELDDDVLRPFGEQAATGDDQVRGRHEVAGLAFVDDQKVDTLEDFVKFLVRDGNPEIHRVGDDEGRGRAAVQHLELVFRGHVREDDDRRVRDRRRHFHRPVFEDVDVDLFRGAVVHVLVVFAGPGKRIAL